MDRHQQHYVNLSAELLRLGRYKEAESVATRALVLNPKLSHARYNRGLARNEIGSFIGAKTDFATIVASDPLFYLAKSAYEAVSSKVPEDELDADAVADVGFPPYRTMGDLPADVDHIGKGKATPCRFYNHEGCNRGIECSFLHAPDAESVRDDVGRNVCLHYLLGKCKWGDYSCIYSHSKTDLPADGWWTDPDQVATIKDTLQQVQAEKKKAHEDRIANKVGKPPAKFKSKKNKSAPSSRPHDNDQTDAQNHVSTANGDVASHDSSKSDTPVAQNHPSVNGQVPVA